MPDSHQIYIHDGEEVTIMLACDHAVASINPAALISRYANGLIQPTELASPPDAITVILEPLDAGAIRKAERGARPRESSRGLRIASRIETAGRDAIGVELKAAAVEKRLPDTSVTQAAMDREEMGLSAADAQALDTHKEHRIAVIYAICSASIQGICLGADGVQLSDHLAKSKHADLFNDDAYPAEWVADNVISPTLMRWALAHNAGFAQRAKDCQAAYDTTLDAIRDVEGALKIAVTSDAAAQLNWAMPELTRDDAVSETTARILEALDLDDALGLVTEFVQASFDLAECRRLSLWNGTTDGRVFMAEVETHVRRLANAGKVL